MECSNYKNCENFKEKVSLCDTCKNKGVATMVVTNCNKYVSDQPKIYVPYGVQFTAATSTFSIGLLFNNNNLELSFNKISGFIRVQESPKKAYFIRPILIPCKKEDIGLGEWGYRSSKELNPFADISGYALNAGDEMVYIDTLKYIGEVIASWDFWWKAVEDK